MIRTGGRSDRLTRTSRAAYRKERCHGHEKEPSQGRRRGPPAQSRRRRQVRLQCAARGGGAGLGEVGPPGGGGPASEAVRRREGARGGAEACREDRTPE